MKIIKFRILNYKSIIDSGDCYPAEIVTILAGKNESGKSSILEALEDFDVDRAIREKATPIKRREHKPAISIWFEIAQNDLKEICSTIGKVIEKFPENAQICFTKTPPNKYEIKGEFIDESFDEPKFDNTQQVKDAYSAIATTTIKETGAKTVPLPPLALLDLDAAISTFTTYQTQIAPHLPAFTPPDQAILKDGLVKLIDELKIAKSNAVTPVMKFRKELLRYLPNFILFNSFDDVFPNSIPISKLKENEWIKDLQAMTDINVDVIAGKNDRDKVTHKKHLNTRLNEDFKQFWTQDLSQLVIEWDNEKLMFWIEEGGEYYEPEIRSQGRRWHLAFYIKVSARAREDVQNVILIDEPGLYLHANAQRDILRNLESAGKDSQVIFSTHSPYLIEPDKLERIRLIQKFEDTGTVIENKIHSVSDKETLTPILTAIGLELTASITNINQRDNIVVEGASDYFYLNAFKNIFSWEGVNFISGGSSGNMTKIGTILQGWGCNVVYLYDNDQAYKDALRSIKRDWLTINTELVGKLPIDGAIEDIFSVEDFKKYVLKNSNANISDRNSDYMKTKDKVLVAKVFLEKVNKEPKNIKLDAKTIANATRLKEVVDSLFDKAKTS